MIYYIIKYKPGLDALYDDLMDGVNTLGLNANHITEVDALELKRHGYPTPYMYGNGSKLFERRLA